MYFANWRINLRPNIIHVANAYCQHTLTETAYVFTFTHGKNDTSISFTQQEESQTKLTNASMPMIVIMTMYEKDFIVIITLMILMMMHQRDIRCEASLQIHHQSTTTQNDYLINEMPQERMDQLKIPKDQTLVVRLPSNTLLKYNSYKDVSILHFRMPPDTRRAMFTFKAIEESKSAFQRKCKPRDVTLHLKASSYPVISPENITFPRNFLSADERFKIYNLQFQSDEMQQRITVDGPQVGNWFAVAFISWTDPNNDRIEQQGLAASCDTLLLAEMSVSRFHPIIINNGQVHNNTLTSNSVVQNANVVNNVKYSNNSTLSDVDIKVTTSTTKTKTTAETNTTVPKTDSITETYMQTPSSNFSTQSPNTASTLPLTSASTSTPKSYSKMNMNNRNSSTETTNNEIIYKFYVPRNIGVATARISFAHVCSHCPDVGFHIQANAFPSIGAEAEKSHESNYIHSTIIKPNQTGEISIEFYVQPMTWHYALLKFVSQRGFMANSILGQIQPEDKQNEHVPLRNSENLQRLKRHEDDVVTAAMTEGNETATWYHLPFVMQIDFYEPSDQDTKSESNENANKHDEMKNEGTSENNVNETSVNNTHSTSERNIWEPKPFRDMEFYPLLRQTYREFFMYDYDLVPDENGTVPSVLNLTAGMPAGFAFDVGEVYDIGGTLSFAVSMKHGLKASNPEAVKAMPSIPSTSERSGILAEKLIGSPNMDSNNDGEQDKGKSNGKNLPRSNQTIIVCMHLGEPGEPTWPDKCRYGRRLLPASSIVNNTDSNTSTGLIHVPFPESGRWYVTMGLYCHGAETTSRATIIDSVKDFVKKFTHMLEYMRHPCACASKLPRYRECVNDPNCFAAMNETETLKIKECLMDSKCTSNHLEMTQKFEIHHKFATEQHFAIDNCSTSVVFTISSSPCVAGRCGRYGRCYHYMSGGFVFSTCVCMKGYRGWDCTEDSQVPSSISILMASLLLTLSNLLFFPSIYIAGRRQFYTEAVIYFFAMFFSIFYHACDSGEDEYSFCLVKIGVLQFCDFYCGLLAIWVTLVAMSHVRQQFVSLLHMLGAILLAFGTELNKQSLWVFLAPALTGICLISASWGMRCYKSRKWFPARRYLIVYMPLGTVLVMVGLVCYAFLQTKQNYHIVHSVWHMVMALSILCLLPSRKSFIPKC
ncbi:uncharacterized protein LOC119601033 [Lucilia sericata]|uniref:uncharacterized protein LOC119601033 n=1 Tax=Lucilia sericata TaxID=13632 RepID=UPI0018A862DF|nr:uncharacterized protein LOC119601033 [Lucilia sericata]XP_037807635.1 uncharacterized protein LOC119601033 [Lucilia sericata]XP_037807636.1 uncharacterized protein LOC119601033 [Lucilia sericata]XP_037807637.1 uncharacterized protein LOC119601033 [Lucilia sericata]XP_037807638.1 uncharacterized protein LOC119601033 [Lucilia sericata]XP_037807639.1 uncharacterized protein LOC119601033 [Lucilia sericata]XP_037807641.1 uncharacterized protein LOC119601033 [Lucilia sericata]XP_037807642.1 unc